MTASTLHDGATSAELAAVAAAVDSYVAAVADAALDALSDADLLAEARLLELAGRRLAAVWNELIPLLERRRLPGQLSATGAASMLSAMFLLSPHEAKARVMAAHDFGPRTGLTGEQLPRSLPATAQRLASGELSTEQGRQISKVLDQLPGSVPAAGYAEAEQILVRAGSTLPPRQLGQVGQRLIAHLDPDGVLNSDAEHQRHRSFSLTPMANGSYEARGRLTPACGALLMAWLTPRSAPQPADDGLPDRRTYGQRMHDALAELAEFQVRDGRLIDSGAPATVVITMSAEQLSGGAGYAETSFGQLISIPDALRMAGEADLALMLRDGRGAILAEHRSRRIATRSQTLALIARDRGCSFPDCDRPPEWCQRHHIVPWHAGGLTDLANLTLLCHAHHRRFEAEGWSCTMRDGLPTWTPPAWIDPGRKPRQNIRLRSAAIRPRPGGNRPQPGGIQPRPGEVRRQPDGIRRQPAGTQSRSERHRARPEHLGPRRE